MVLSLRDWNCVRCVMSSEKEWDRERSCYIAPNLIHFILLRSGKKYFYKMLCVLKVLLYIQIPMKILLLCFRTLLGLLLVKSNDKDFHLLQPASSTLTFLYCLHSHGFGIPLLIPCTPGLCLLSISCMSSVNTLQNPQILRPKEHSKCYLCMMFRSSS